MSVREDESRKNCPSRGLGVAAAAIGVGVGAALYYFFSKRAENPAGAGSTSDWSSEEPQALLSNEDDDSYTTISENSTSDTSMHDDTESPNTSYESNGLRWSSSDSEDSYSNTDTEEFESDSDVSQHRDTDGLELSTPHEIYSPMEPLESDIDSETEWDITTSSADIPIENLRSPLSVLFGSLSTYVRPRRRRPTEEQKKAKAREEAFRQRTVTTEECSICFDKMVAPQEVMALPCTHRFHQDCILPWLQEQQTCPMCRKSIE